MPLGLQLQGNGVVEVAGVDRIDSDDRQAGQIEPPGGNRGIELFGLHAGFFQGVGGEPVGQVVLANDRQRIDARRAVRPEHFGDRAFAVMHGRRETDHFEHDLVVGPRALGAGVADVDRLRKHRAVNLHIGRPARLEIGADELVGLAIEHLDDLAAGAALAWPAVVQLHHDYVAGGGIARPLLRNVDIVGPGVGAGFCFFLRQRFGADSKS